MSWPSLFSLFVFIKGQVLPSGKNFGYIIQKDPKRNVNRRDKTTAEFFQIFTEKEDNSLKFLSLLLIFSKA
jgi:hypothetical protein